MRLIGDTKQWQSYWWWTKVREVLDENRSSATSSETDKLAESRFDSRL
jgi:hypothetical protein